MTTQTLLLLIGLGLAGCVSIGPGTVTRDRFDYSSAVAESWKSQMLMNLVKLRYGDTPVFLDVGQIISGYTVEGTLSAIGTLFSAPGVVPGVPDSSVGLGAQGRYTDRPTITYAPLVGGRLARALGLPGSFRTMVRLVHGAPFPLPKAPRVIGLDEWAWRRGRRFGTIVCALERHHVLDLLPVRSAPAVAPWLQAHPSVEIVCRDRRGLYAEGIRQGAPQAIQVVDRFHLVQNLHDALERFFLRYRRDLHALGASFQQSSELTPTPAMLSQARHARWVHRDHQIQQLHAQHVGIAAIARQVRVSRPTVYRYLAMPQPPERQRSRPRGPLLITPFIPYLRRRWHAGCRNAQQLWRELVAQGHRPSQMTVERDVGQLRRETGTRRPFRQVAPAPLDAEDQDESRPAPLTALRAARLFLATPEEQRPTDQALLTHLLHLDPVMPPTYRQVQAFCRMIRERRGDAWEAWVTEVQQTRVKARRGFVQGWLKDEAAVRAGLSLVWSHGPTEGFIHRLQLITRQAYGRAGVDCLRHRILAPSTRAAA